MPNFDPVLSDKLLGVPFAGLGTTLERNALQTLIKNLISENKYSVEYIINLCVSYGYHRKMAKEVFTELTGLSPELIIENNEYYQNPVFVPSGTIAWGLAKNNDKIAYYIVPFEYGYALNKKNETEVPEQVAQFVDINSAADKMKGLVKRVFTIDQIITENLLLDEPIQSSARNPRDTEEPYFSDPVRNLKNRYIKRYITDGEVKSEAFKLVASGEITEKEGTELAEWVSVKQEKRDLEDEEEIEFGSIKKDPAGKLQEEAQEKSRLKASADEETAKCFICEETYPTSELKEEEDIGLICDHCIKGMKSQGYELKLKASKKVKADEDFDKYRSELWQYKRDLPKYKKYNMTENYGIAKSRSDKALHSITKKPFEAYLLSDSDHIIEEKSFSTFEEAKMWVKENADKAEEYIIGERDKDGTFHNIEAFSFTKKSSLKRKADELKLEDIKEEEQKSSVEKAEDEINETDVEELFAETTPQAFFDEEIKKDKIDNLNEKVSKIIDEFSNRFEDFEKYDVALQSYKIQMIADDKLEQTETIKDLELNAKAIIMIVLSINPKEDATNVKKGLAIFSVNDDKTYWSGTFKSEDNKFYAFTEEGLDALYRDLDTKEELVEDIVGNSKVSI